MFLVLSGLEGKQRNPASKLPYLWFVIFLELFDYGYMWFDPQSPDGKRSKAQCYAPGNIDKTKLQLIKKLTSKKTWSNF